MSQPSRRRRRHFSPEEKATILRRHLADKVPISDLAEEHKIQPTVLYQWQRQLLDHAARAFEPQGRTDRHEQQLQARISALEAKVQRKDSVIAEISEEYVSLKKELGGSGRQGRDPAGGSPAAPVARFRRVAIPHPGAGNQPGDAWCKRSSCPERVSEVGAT